jgi:DNA-binding MarR family transcriptional regulator
MSADPRLILREDELDQGLELMLIAESGLWGEVDSALEAAGAGRHAGLGRSHWRALFLIRRRPGVGILDLASLSGLSKQSASKTMAELAAAGLANLARDELDGRRRGAVLTDAGAALEEKVTERLRARIAGAYRTVGAEGVLSARRLLAALAGGRLAAGRRDG